MIAAIAHANANNNPTGIMLAHPKVFKYEDAVSELVKAAERVDDYRELQYWANIVKQMTPPKFCRCDEQT